MIIDDSLRQEDMPEMVFSLCKLALSVHDQEKLRKLITLGHENTKSTDQYAIVFRFAKKCGFLLENGTDKVQPAFTAEELSDFRHFRFSVLKRIAKDRETEFIKLTKWFLSYDFSANNRNHAGVLALTSAESFKSEVPNEIAQKSTDFVLGSRFWMTALGISSFYAPGDAVALLPAMHKILLDWFEFEHPFTENIQYSFRTLVKALMDFCPIFKSCFTENNSVTEAMSMALRVLNELDVIHLIKANDAHDRWNLGSSIAYSDTNLISDFIYKGVG